MIQHDAKISTWREDSPHHAIGRFLLHKAEGTGFEPVMPCGIFAFQANALDHYANPPEFPTHSTPRERNFPASGWQANQKQSPEATVFVGAKKALLLVYPVDEGE